MAFPVAKIIDLPKIADPRGNLTFVEQWQHIPFEINNFANHYPLAALTKINNHRGSEHWK